MLSPNNNRLIYLSLFLLFAMRMNSFSQLLGLQKVDSLVIAYQNCQSDTGKVNLLGYISFSCSSVNPSLGIDYGNQGIKLATEISFKKGLALNLNSAGICYLQKSLYSEALDYFYKALKINEELNNEKESSKNYNNIGMVFNEQDNFTNALENYFKALAINEKYGNKLLCLKNYINIGNIYDNMDSSKKALDYYNKALQYAVELNYQEGIAKALLNIGVINNKNGQYLLAHDNFKAALKINEELCDEVSERKTLLNLAGLYFTIIQEKNQNIKRQFTTNDNATCSFMFEKYSMQAVDNAKKIGAYADLYYAYMMLADYYSMQKQYNKAFDYLKLGHQYYDSAFSQETQMKLLKLEGKRESELKDKEIVILVKDKENQSIREKLLSIIVALAFLFASIILFFFYRKKKDNIKLHEQNLKILETTKELEITNHQLEKKETALIKSNATKDRFFAIISHDLRTPIYSFNSLTKILSEYYPELTEDQRITHIQSLDNSSKNIINLLDNLLVWSQLQNNKSDFHPDNFNIVELINEEIKNQKEISEIKNISIKFLNFAPLFVFADPDMIRTVLRNLIANAIKFSFTNSCVEISAKTKNELIEVEIKDSGIGIAQENQNKLFKIDVKYSTFGTAKEKGTGLGLILCKEFIERNSGGIGFVSNEGVGSTFYFSLPIAILD